MTASMDPRQALATDASASILAILLAAKGHVSERELAELERSNAFELLGVTRDQFIALTEAGCMDFSANLHEHQWLSSADLSQIDQILATVSNPQQRLLICRLAAATHTTDAKMSKYERLLYDHARAQWHVTEMMVEDAQSQVEHMKANAHTVA